MSDNTSASTPSREQLIPALYEAAELEHNLMCTYLYAAFSLKDGRRGLSSARSRGGKALAPGDPRCRDRRDGASRRRLEHHVGARRRAALRPRQLPDRSGLPAGGHRREARAVQRRSAAALHLTSNGRIGLDASRTAKAFEMRDVQASARAAKAALTPMGVDYETVGVFYTKLGAGSARAVGRLGEAMPSAATHASALRAGVDLDGVKPVHLPQDGAKRRSMPSSRRARAPARIPDSHFCRFRHIRDGTRRR